MVHPNSLANLRPPWRPGQSGNPRGLRPGSRSVLDIVTPEGREALYRSLFKQALKGDVAAARLLLDRLDPALLRRELTGAEAAPVQVEQVERVDLSDLTNEELETLAAIAAARVERACGAR